MRGFLTILSKKSKKAFWETCKISKESGKGEYEIGHQRGFYFNGVSELIPKKPTELNKVRK